MTGCQDRRRPRLIGLSWRQPQTCYFEVTSAGRRRRRPRFWRHSPQLVLRRLPLAGDERPFPSFQRIYTSSRTGIVAGFGSWIAILIGVVLTAFFVPNMLRKGTVDMLVVKPIHRVTLLLYKYIGGLTFIFLNTVVASAASGWRSACAPASGPPASW